MTLLTDFQSALTRLAPEGRLLVAVSGGADSVAALRLCHDLGRDLVVAHFDHNLRPSSGADAEFVRALCASLDVEFVRGAADVVDVARQRRWNLEDAARRLRYDFLYRAARSAGCNGIVVAHTRDDQAETVLMQAFRGSAFPSGMPAKRGMVVRPLLSVGRTELRAYLLGNSQPWREDESNLDVTRARAWLRHEVMPVVTRRYPLAAERLAATATVLRAADEALDTVAGQVLGERPLKLRALSSAPVAVQRSALARLVESAGATPSFELIERVREQVRLLSVDPDAGPWRVSLDAERYLRVAYGSVDVARRGGSALIEPTHVGSVEEFAAVSAALGAARAATRAAAFDGAAGETNPAARDLPTAHELRALLTAHPGGLTARHRLPGDRVRLSGGGRAFGKSLADLLIDRKVPAESRDALLVLAAGDDVVWVEGVPLRSAASGEPQATHGQGAEAGELSSAAADLRYMRLSLDLARTAGDAGELPVGAVVVRGGEVLAAAGNRTEEAHDPSAHAELLALREAAATSGDWRLEGATLYVTLEPCPMCFGAVLQTRVARVVYGADNVREGALGSVMDLRYGLWKRRPQVEGGLLATESAGLLRAFFAGKR